MTIQHDIDFEIIPGNGGDLAQITLDRPRALNALTHEMIQQMTEHLIAWSKSDAIKAVIIYGEGDRAFCAGGDIKKVYEKGKNNPTQTAEFFRDEYRLNHLIHHYKKPYIALMDGITMGGGVGVAMHGSHRIASEGMSFAMPETGIGFFPDVGASYLLSRCRGNMGIYLGLTGAQLRMNDAYHVGLIDSFVPRDHFSRLIDAIARTDFMATGTIADLVDQFSQSPEPSELAAHEESVETCFTGPSVESIFDKLKAEKNPWCDNTLALLKTRSPTSLKVTLRQLLQGRELDFDACMQMEYRLVNHFIRQPEFYEGVRAAVIDKDREPKWEPDCIDKVAKETLDAYFQMARETELTFINI